LPNKKSAKKRVLTNKKAELRNKAAKSAMKTAIKTTTEAVLSGAENAEALLRATQALIGRTWTRGVIHKNKAARLQSRLMKRAARAAAERQTNS